MKAHARAPVRTCVTCRRERPKAELIRFVRHADGIVGLDPTGTAPGRGAYVCREVACVDGAAKRLPGALRAPVDAERIRRELTDVGVA